MDKKMIIIILVIAVIAIAAYMYFKSKAVETVSTTTSTKSGLAGLNLGGIFGGVFGGAKPYDPTSGTGTPTKEQISASNNVKDATLALYGF